MLCHCCMRLPSSLPRWRQSMPSINILADIDYLTYDITFLDPVYCSPKDLQQPHLLRLSYIQQRWFKYSAQQFLGQSHHSSEQHREKHDPNAGPYITRDISPLGHHHNLNTSYGPGYHLLGHYLKPLHVTRDPMMHDEPSLQHLQGTMATLHHQSLVKNEKSHL